MLLDFDDIHAGNARDVLAAVPDAVCMALGSHAVRTPHPFAEWAADAPLRAAAYAAGQILSPRRGDEPQAAVIGRGLRTLDFGRALAAGLEAAARRRFDLQAQHTAAVATVDVTRIGQPEPVGALDLSVPFEDVGDGLEYKASMGALRDGESITLTSLGRLIGVTRATVYNDDLGLIEDAISATGVAAARHEARLVAAALEANGNLTDGNPVFHADYGNLIADAFGATGDGLAAAIAALRSMPAADGHALDAQAATVFCAPDLEYLATNFVSWLRGGQILLRPIAGPDFFSGAGLPPLSVQVLAGLPAGRYFVSASPNVARSIALARLDGQNHPLTVEAVRTPISYDGQILRVRIDTGAAMVGRLGIVKGGA
jgi:hypothetical protein